ncbi:MAG: hypothetical protein ACOY0T_17405, partial [Myxococcota bacterium]
AQKGSARTDSSCLSNHTTVERPGRDPLALGLFKFRRKWELGNMPMLLMRPQLNGDTLARRE